MCVVLYNPPLRNSELVYIYFTPDLNFLAIPETNDSLLFFREKSGFSNGVCLFAVYAQGLYFYFLF